MTIFFSALLYFFIQSEVSDNTLLANKARWHGRTIQDSTGGVSFSWEGSECNFQFSGATSVSATLKSSYTSGSARLRVVVDNIPLTNPFIVNPGDDKVFLLASGLDASSKHNITLYAITDPISMSWPIIANGTITALSFSIDTGTFLDSPLQSKRRIRIIGDSITAGNQISNITCEDDHYFAYGSLLCRFFDADCQTQAISGKGIYQNCCDFNETMVEIGTRTVPGDISSVWDDSHFIPDAILINLGTNDQGKNNGSAWIAGFVQTYTSYLVSLARLHGNLNMPFFLGVGPITHDYAPWVEAAAADAAALGLTNLHFISYNTQVDRCGHPDFNGHVLMFEAAQPIISSVMGW